MMMAVIYRVFRRIANIFEKAYLKSKVSFKTKQGKKTCIIDKNVQILCPNVVLGDNVHLYSNVIIWGSGKVEIDDNSKIGFNTIIYASKNAGVYIGRNVEMAANTYIIDSNHSLAPDRMANPKDSAEKIYIGNNTWIGASCICAKGAFLGDGSVLGANSFLNSKIPEMKLAVGSPARIIKDLKGI